MIWLFVADAVPFSELRVKVLSPDTKILGAVVVTVCWPERVRYVYSEPEKSLIGMVVLIVERSELVKVKAWYPELAPLEVEEDVEDSSSVAVAVVETSVPVPVSSCALTPKAARPNIHKGRDNMVWCNASRCREEAGESQASPEKTRPDRR